MKRRALQVAAVALAVVVMTAASFFLRPFWWLERLGKAKLRTEGLERAEIAGARGAIVYWRGGAGPGLVLLHGANDQAGSWSRIAEPLARSRRLVLPDLPGHGESAPTEGALALADLMAGLESLMDEEWPSGKVTLAGNSLGGYLAMLYAHRHPERVEHVILLNGAVLQAEPGVAINLLPKTRDEARRAVEALTDPASPAAAGFVLDDLVRRAPTSPLARLMQSPFPADLLEGRLGEMTVPVTLLWGESDRYMPVAYAESIQRQLKASRLERIPLCGHVPHRECPDRLVALIERALRAPPPR